MTQLLLQQESCHRQYIKEWLWLCSSSGLVANSCLTLATPWTVAHQAPLSIGLSRQEYWSGLPFPSPGDLPNPGIEPGSLNYRQILYWLSYQGSPCSKRTIHRHWNLNFIYFSHDNKILFFFFFKAIKDVKIFLSSQLSKTRWWTGFVLCTIAGWSTVQSEMAVKSSSVWFVLLGNLHVATEEFFYAQVLFFIGFHEK